MTLGFYTLYWWYKINREMADVGRSRDVRELGDLPILSLLAFSLGAYLVVPFIWTVVTTSRRVKCAQHLAERTDQLNGAITAALWILTLGLGALVYTQTQLNKVWQSGVVATPAPAERMSGRPPRLW